MEGLGSPPPRLALGAGFLSAVEAAADFAAAPVRADAVEGVGEMMDFRGGAVVLVLLLSTELEVDGLVA